MKTRSLFAAGVGAGLTYFLDPGRGARRRARVRDTVTRSARVTRRAIGTVGRDMLHRTYGTAASLRSPFRHDRVDDAVVVERVRSRLGRLVSHPHAVEVMSADGIVKLRGPILEREADILIRAVRHVDGVRDVIDELERHERAGKIPSLQGGRPPAASRLDALQPHWAQVPGML